jgi:hypothetical protein
MSSEVSGNLAGTASSEQPRNAVIAWDAIDDFHSKQDSWGHTACWAWVRNYGERLFENGLMGRKHQLTSSSIVSLMFGAANWLNFNAC